MSERLWYSATLRFFIVVAGAGKIRAEDSVVVVKASSFGDATVKFLDLGRQRETGFRNAFGEEVRHRFVEITTLDVIANADLDGVEVACTPIFDADPLISFDTPFEPAKSKPTQSI